MEYCWNFKMVMSKRLYFFLLSIFFMCLCAIFATINYGYPQAAGEIVSVSLFYSEWCPFTGGADLRLQQRNESEIYERNTQRLGGGKRKLLGGPGSFPPRCISRCGRCTPCRPVHVPVPPGTPVTAEYYPEAWRCKCGNKLYMP